MIVPRAHAYFSDSDKSHAGRLLLLAPAQQARSIANTRAITLRGCIRERSVRIGRLNYILSLCSRAALLFIVTFLNLVPYIRRHFLYLAVTVMTAASTVLAKSVRFLEHVSPGCCAGIASIVPVSWSA